jgi:hypothetical protein
MGLASLIESLEDWSGTPVAGHPPRPPWLREMLSVVVMAELSHELEGTDSGRVLYESARRTYESAAEKVALNPQPLPPLE